MALGPAILTPIGPEGARLNRMQLREGNQVAMNPGSLDQNELLRQLSVYRDIDAQRGLNPDESQALQGLLDEQRRRDVGGSADSTQQILDIFGGGGGGGDVQSDPNGLVGGLEDAIGKQRENLNKLYSSQVTGATDKYNETVAPLRRKMLQEQSALGRLGSPVSQNNIDQFDTSRDQGLADIIRGLNEENFKQNAGLEGSALDRLQEARTNAAQMGLSKAQSLASLIQQGNQFNRNFGLDEQAFMEKKRANAIGDLRSQQAIDLAAESGRRQAEGEDDTLGNVAGIIGGIGGMATGVGGLAGGIAAYKGIKGLSDSANKKKPTPFMSSTPSIPGQMRASTAFSY